MLRYLRDKGVTYDVYLTQPEAVAESVFGGDMGIPLSVFVDAEGKVIDVFPVRSIDTEQRWAQLVGRSE